MNDKIDIKLDKIIDKLGEHSEVLAKHGVIHERNTADLSIHIKRTDLLSDHMDAEHTTMKKDMETVLLPIKSFKFLTKLAAGYITINVNGADYVMPYFATS